MNVKWFLRGLGVGIVLTALLLCITYRNTKGDTNIIQQAKNLGMIFPEEETAAPAATAEELAQQVQPDSSSGAAVSGSVVAGQGENESEADKKARKKLEQSNDDITSASNYQGGKKTFVVRSGLLSSSVAREMEAAGIIDSADAFDEFIEKNGYGRKVRSGTYKIPDGADYETIAKIITRQD